MKLGDNVKLVTFNGLKNNTEENCERENYWKLIGYTGTVIKLPYEKYFTGRVLVKFNFEINSINLDCHNEFADSLWILETDLEKIQ